MKQKFKLALLLFIFPFFSAVVVKENKKLKKMVRFLLLIIFSIFSFAGSARESHVAKTGNGASVDKRIVYKAAMDTITNW